MHDCTAFVLLYRSIDVLAKLFEQMADSISLSHYSFCPKLLEAQKA